MSKTLKFLETKGNTQFPKKMRVESKYHAMLADSNVFKPQTFDYFVTYNKENYKPPVNTENCEGEIGTGTTTCPSDHLPIYMDYNFQEIEIRVISWNIQYFINDGNSKKILDILKKLISDKVNFIILLQEIKGKTNNKDLSEKFEPLIAQLKDKYRDLRNEVAGFQATIFNFENPDLTFFKVEYIERCISKSSCQKIDIDYETQIDSERQIDSETKKYSSLLLIFSFSKKDTPLEKNFLLVNNVHLVSPGTEWSNTKRFTEFNHILSRNRKILGEKILLNNNNSNYDVIFGGDMNTGSFHNITKDPIEQVSPTQVSIIKKVFGGNSFKTKKNIKKKKIIIKRKKHLEELKKGGDRVSSSK